jgi:hypothetical protein
MLAMTPDARSIKPRGLSGFSPGSRPHAGGIAVVLAVVGAMTWGDPAGIVSY